MISSITSPIKSPFYKWSWRKKHGDRVWGERIVREAFKKAKISYTKDDLQFFQNQCELFEQGNAISNESILQYVDTILNRKIRTKNAFYQLIQPVLDDALKHTAEEAQSELRTSNNSNPAQNAVGNLAVVRFEQILQKIGAEILSPNLDGFTLDTENPDPSMTFNGLYGYEYCIQSLQNALDSYLNHSPLVKQTRQQNFLKLQVLNDLLPKYQSSLREARTYYKKILELCKQESSELTDDQIEQLEMTLLFWKVNENIRFHSIEFQLVNEFLLYRDLNPYFRTCVICAVLTNYESLVKFHQHLPSNVIFFGKNATKRELLAQEYANHLHALIKLSAGLMKQRFYSPLHIPIYEDEIESARAGMLQMDVNFLEEELDVEEYDLEETSTTLGHMVQLIDVNRARSLFEKNQEYSKADKYNWIIEIRSDALTPEEHAQLDTSHYREYQQINSDVFCCEEYNSLISLSDEQQQHCVTELFKILIPRTLRQNQPEPEYSTEEI